MNTIIKYFLLITIFFVLCSCKTEIPINTYTLRDIYRPTPMVAAVQVDTITFNSQIVEIRGKIGPKHIIIHADNDVGPETNTDGIALLSSGKTYLMALLPPFLATKFGLGDVIQVPLKCPKIYKATNIHNNNVYPITKDVFNHVVTPSLDDLKDTPIYWMKL